MTLQAFTLSDAVMTRSPDHDADIFTGDLVDGGRGEPVSIGYGRWGPGARLSETMLVDDVMIVLEGDVTVSADGRTVSAGVGGIVHMPKGTAVTITAGEAGAVTAYVTAPPWRAARA